MKAIAIGVSKVNPLVEIGDCCSCVHLHIFFPKKRKIRYKELFPNTYFYIGLYSRFSPLYRDHFNTVTFKFKIDHDDGTVNTDYAMRKLDMNHLKIVFLSIEL